MGYLVKNFTLICFIFFSMVPAYCIIKGGIDYKIPIDYSKINQEQLDAKAQSYYTKALNSNVLNDDMTTALNLYTILTKKNPDNIIYALRLGKLYDVIGKDRYAKGEYYKAVSLKPSAPEPYYYLGDYFYTREQYKKALKFYKLAYEKGYNNHYQTLYKIGNIYQKFGDSKAALQYLTSASSVESNIDLDLKIQQLKNFDTNNREYYKR